MKLLIRLLALALALAAASTADAWTKPKADEVKADEVRVVRWEGATDADMLKQARADIESATAKDSKIKVLKVHLLSQGGPVVSSLELARIVRKASDAGLVVEIHAEGLCASGCTWVLASGTPGRRFIGRSTLFLVHPIQVNGGCVSHVEKPTTERDKILNALLVIARDAYVKYTGRKKEEAEDWLSCGQERAGDGELAVSLNMADKVED